MRWSLPVAGLGVGLVLFVGVLRGQQPAVVLSPPPGAIVVQPPGKDKDKQKPPDKKDKDRPPPFDATARESTPPLGELDLSTLQVPTRAPEMLGDQPPPRFPVVNPPIVVIVNPPPPGGGGVVNNPGIPGGGRANPGAGATSIVALPGARGFKVADNGSPRPQDRAYLTFNYFDNLNGAINRQLGGNLSNANGYRETFGVEKTFLDGLGSVELRLPLQTFSASSLNPDLGHTSTALGDLSLVLRVAAYRDAPLDNYLTFGLAVTPPTGPSTFGGIHNAVVLHKTTIQPFAAALWHFGNFYAQGFTALDLPTDHRDLTLWYNDLGVGYFLYQNTDASRLLTAVAPTVEAHVTAPLDHRSGVLGVPDLVNLTAGINFELHRKAVLATGIMVPVTSPRPFDVEATVQFRCRF